MSCNKFNCPYAVRKKQYRFIMCKAFMKEGVNYNDKVNALNAFCGEQYFCPITRNNELMEGAKKCYSYQSSNKG